MNLSTLDVLIFLTVLIALVPACGVRRFNPALSRVRTKTTVRTKGRAYEK
jgi:hypothetical protein